MPGNWIASECTCIDKDDDIANDGVIANDGDGVIANDGDIDKDEEADEELWVAIVDDDDDGGSFLIDKLGSSLGSATAAAAGATSPSWPWLLPAKVMETIWKNSKSSIKTDLLNNYRLKACNIFF